MAEDVANPPETSIELVEPSFKGLGQGAKTVQALELMVYEGLDHKIAAQRLDMNPEVIAKALKRPHVKARFNQIHAHIRSGAGTRAYSRINHLAQTADSEHVQLQANAWVAGVEGIAPIKRVEGNHSVTHNFGGFTFGRFDQAKDITPHTDSASDGPDPQTIDNPKE